MTEDNAGYLIKLVSSSLNRMLDQEMAPLDLTAMHGAPSPCCIAAAPTRPPSWRATGTDTGAMTRTLDRLEAKGLLRRNRSQTDRRVVSSNSPSWVKPRRARFRTTSPAC